MKKLILILLFLWIFAFAGMTSVYGQWNTWDVTQWDAWGNLNNVVEYPLQKLDGTLLADGKTLNDTSGNGYDGLLVNSNQSVVDGSKFDTISISPTTEGFAMYNYSVEFTITPSLLTGYRMIINRQNGAGNAHKLVSSICTVNANLYYYSTNGVNQYSSIKIATLTVGVTYVCKVRINSSSGSLSWDINGTPGRSAYTNYTPSGSIANDNFYLFTSSGNVWNYTGSAYDVKIYSDTNYTNLVHWYPIAEGGGKVCYDVVAGYNAVSTTAMTRTNQNNLHYNWRYGFELYGNDTTLIRVPYKINGDKFTPTIDAYTKWAECPSGNHNNFSETGIKRNPANLDTLADLGIDSSNIIYFMGVDGNDSLSFCSNFATKRETNWCIYNSKKNRKTTFSMPLSTKYFRAGTTRRLVSSDSIRHFGQVKKTMTANYDIYIKNGTYNEDSIYMAKNIALIGESKAGTIIRGYKDSTVAVLTYASSSTINWGDSTGYLCNLTVTAENLRYTIHADGINKVHHRYLLNCDFIHYGNLTAESYNDSITSVPKDAWGSGTYPGTYTYAEDCKFYGYCRGFAQHGYGTPNESTDRTITIFKNCEFKNTGVNENSTWNYCLRFNPELSLGKDSLVFINCSYNSQNMYMDVMAYYTALADKVSITTSRPTITLFSSRGWEALRFTGTEGVIGVTAGTTTTLLMGTVYTNSDSNFCYGNKNITDYVAMSGYKTLGYYLGDCSGESKTMRITVDGEVQTITFDEDFTARDNAYVLTFINNQISGAVAEIYEYLTHL